ncbi:unnamed protein product [Fraxinus pennsylvanica]|uniref:Homeobox-leucine zipper protein n=1 Tax=Fraxinus pennsylvanica TaxID=56036 RepID=A0AAD2AE83_9LAMI|nr:unnamed protein product [Fraxinus pennsylvanica]
MDSFQSQTPKKRLTSNQVRLLETSFNVNSKLDPDIKSQLALQLGVPPRQVAIWYQNKRAREKNQSLEIDHKILQVRLENILSHNARLQGEVARLKDELNKVQEMLQTFNSSFSSSSDEVGSTNLIHSSKNHLDMAPYPSFIGDAGQFGPTEGYDLLAICGPARSKQGIGPCCPSESLGCLALRVEETASGWLYRAAMTSHSLQWKDNGPVLPDPIKV